MKIQYVRRFIDRFNYAETLSCNKKVLDIGGQHPLNHDMSHPFGKSYRKIVNSAVQYECFDRDHKHNVKYVGDLNTPSGRSMLEETLYTYKPQVILCMEILEHLNHPHLVMNTLASYLEKNPNVDIFITIPNNGSWFLNALNWHQDHNVAFFKSIAMRFVSRSNLGIFNIKMYPCMQRYKWYWWIVLLVSFMQPFNWGFHIKGKP